jgi:legumain
MLKLIVAVIALAALASAAPTLPSGKYNSKGGLNWVLLIAGSNSYGNYRHQADIYHAYQVVKKNGVPDANTSLSSTMTTLPAAQRTRTRELSSTTPRF